MGTDRISSIFYIAALTVLFSNGIRAIDNDYDLLYQNYADGISFEFPYYTGIYENSNITIDPIKVSGDNGNITYYLVGDNVDNFSLVLSANTVNIILQRPFTTDFIEKTDFMLFTLNGFNNGTSIVGRTAIHIFFTRRANCKIDGVTDTDWISELFVDIVDTDTGVTFRRNTDDTINITDVQYLRGELTNPPYLNINLTNGELVISLNSRFSSYENFETSQTMTVIINFKCARDFRKLTLVHRIRDTNNHAPQFLPGNSYNYTITTPLGAGVPFTMLYGDIIVRDVDLTNQGIIPLIESNDYFRLQYVGTESGVKDHKLALVTTRAINTINTPLSFFIIATDNDTTGYPAISSFATVVVAEERSNKFQFQKQLYEGIYDLDLVILSENIILENSNNTNNITFTLSGEWSDNFNASYVSGNIALIVKDIIPEEFVLNRDYIILNLTATRGALEPTSTNIHLSLIKDPTCRLIQETEWLSQMTINIFDTNFTSTFMPVIRNAQYIDSISYDQHELNNPEYVDITLSLVSNNTVILIKLTPEFQSYEDRETSLTMTTFVTFKCTRGTRRLKIVHVIRDTNNHSPEFLPRNTYSYIIHNPINANFPISTAYGDIIVRDVDLTNTGILPSIDSNDFFRLEYGGVECDKKNHRLILSTIRPIMSNFTIEFNITATDVDTTGNNRRTSSALVTIRTETYLNDEEVEY